jgi:hypothetical protein
MTTGREGRIVNVPPSRLAGWLDGFADRHGLPEVTVSESSVNLRCPDQATASIKLAWGPLPGLADPLSELVAAVSISRRVGALIVHRRAHAIGVFDGPALVAGRHHSHYVQGRTKAGGWSQQRYARRRANQVDRAYSSAISDAAQLLVPTLGLVALATGGDQSGVDTVLADKGLAPLLGLPRLRVPGIPDPNAGVLAAFGERYRQVPIVLNEYA